MKASAYLSLPQAARTARVPRRELLAAIHRHELPAKLHLGRWWIAADELEHWRYTRHLLQRVGGELA